MIIRTNICLGVSRRERKTNESIRESLGVKQTITDTIQKKRLKWFGHIVRLAPENYMSRAYKQTYNTPRPSGRPPKRWSSQITEDLGISLATAERTALNRKEWRSCSRKERARVLGGLCNYY